MLGHYIKSKLHYGYFLIGGNRNYLNGDDIFTIFLFEKLLVLANERFFTYIVAEMCKG